MISILKDVNFIIFIFLVILFTILAVELGKRAAIGLPFTIMAASCLENGVKITEGGGRLKHKKNPRNFGKVVNRSVGEVKNIKHNPQSKFETRVRDIFGNIAKGALKLAESKGLLTVTEGKDTRYKFYTMYPSWLRWKGKELEIDGYNVLLGLAFEVQGPQHTKYDKKIDKDYEAYYNRLCNDAAKHKLAEEFGVGIITIDYTVPKYLLSDYIKSRIYDLCKSNPPINKLRCDLLEPISTHPPTNYIAKIEPEPFRDFRLEETIGLMGLQ